MPAQPRSGCAINAAVEVLGDNWSLIVLRDIIFGNRRHFRELLTCNDEGIASNVLASRLRKLIDEGLLTKAEAARGQRAQYTLTEAGIQTLPVMVALGTWGMTHRETSPELTIRSRTMADDPQTMADDPQLVAGLMDELRETHLGVPRPNPDEPRSSERLQAAYEAEISGS
ncbi:winged helix-turn-helix transcriptional regulator [Brevibacterium permense]|uniref:Helix-turn-helix domain-containing protein n=1 Tax=Brevibacterium permense TaxID=234834 RepID=A0ABN1ZR36_9MICO|nr:helix-turn-helix domain-containing protein [Brevibacterium permense]